MEDKILELEKRVSILERIEKRRKIIELIKVGLIIILISLIFVIGYHFYKKINDTIKPIKDIIETKNKADNKIDSIKKYFQ